MCNVRASGDRHIAAPSIIQSYRTGTLLTQGGKGCPQRCYASSFLVPTPLLFATLCFVIVDAASFFSVLTLFDVEAGPTSTVRLFFVVVDATLACLGQFSSTALEEGTERGSGEPVHPGQCPVISSLFLTSVKSLKSGKEATTYTGIV